MIQADLISLDPMGNQAEQLDYIRRYLYKTIELVNLALAESNDSVTDAGKNGPWSYRKWQSGMIEIWGEATLTFAVPTAVGGFYRSVVSIDMSSMVTELHDVHPNFVSAGIYTGCINGSDKRVAEIAKWTAMADTARTYTIPIYMKGKYL